MRKYVWLLATVLAAAVSAAPWFDAGVKDYVDWPSNGQSKIVPGVGTWSHTGTTSLMGEPGARALTFGASAEAPLEFAPDAVRSAEDEVTVSFGVQFSASPRLDAPSPEMKGAVTVAVDAHDEPIYYGLVKAPTGNTNCWTALTGAAPNTGACVTVDISVRKLNGVRQVRYVADGVTLSTQSGEWTEIVFPGDGDDVVAMGCYGAGELSSLAGATVTAPPTVDLTIPELAGMTVDVVTAGGAVVTNAGGVYAVPRGEPVVVRFAPADGYVLTNPTMVFTLSASGELPAEGRPQPVPAQDVLSISEVMASNGSTLTTAAGGEGYDWVEIRNQADFPIDISGWYLHDTPDDKKKNWKKIKGTCIVPANGYAIVWADKDYDGFTDVEAYVRIGLSSSGEDLFLASPGGAIVDEVSFSRQIKDVSVGLGRVERTLLSAYAPAEYRLGSGAWTATTGPIGMSAASGGFQVVTYMMNTTINNADEAESFVADSTKWLRAPVTNTSERIAFTASNGGTTADFDYGGFPGGNSDNMVLVVTGGIYIPRAGKWTFAGGSDDGFSATISRLDRSWTWEYRTTRGYGVSYSTFSFPEPGIYQLRLIYFDKSGGKTLDLSVREGEYKFADGGFELVGDVASGVVHAGALGANVATDLSETMKNHYASVDWRANFTLADAPCEGDVFRLRLRYADGFTAKVNGTTVASAATAGPRQPADALTYSYYTIPNGVLVQGVNHLEVTGVNDAIGDADFFLSPEILFVPFRSEFVYYRTPTPGRANGDDGLQAPTPEVQFSVPHGYKTEAFDLALSCAEDATAPIYYTLDGTSPTTGSTRYTSPIHVTGTTVVRAAVPNADSVLQYDASATYIFVDEVLAQGAAAPANFPANQQVNSQKMFYEMNPSVVAANRAKILRGFTNSISTISLVIDPANLFDSSKGIYVNATGNGRSWERPTMVEQISPTNTANEFSLPAGLRIRGAYSRGSGYPKHSFRLFFRSEYGRGKLEHPLFGDEGANEFDKIDLRTAQNNSWANNDGYSSNFTFIEECFSRDSQRDLGEPYTRSRYYHLFINGVYWGVYQTEERVSSDYGETYFGGVAEDYDVVRTSQPGYTTGIAEGTDDAWHGFWDLVVNQGFGGAYSNNYFKAQGLNPDGTRNPEYPAYLNPRNVMVHMLSAHYAADKDAPTAGSRANNIAALYNRTDAGTKLGWIFNRHDAEHSLGRHDTSVGNDRTLYGTSAQNAVFLEQANFSPAEIHYRLCTNLEYRTAFGDLVYRECLRRGGAYTVEKATARFRARMNELDDAVVCESARWGWGTYTYDSWLASCGVCLSFITNRLSYLIPQYRTRGWYPSIDPPAAVDGLGAALADGDRIAYGSRFYLTGGNSGTVYYTTDGTDPRLAGGAVSPSAQTYTGGSPLPQYVAAFPRASGNWRTFDWGCAPAADGSSRAWTAPDYDVACTPAKPWGTGTGTFGFHSKDEKSITTTVAKFADHASSGTQVYTYYFRRSFTAPAEAASSTSLQLNLLYDDCCAIYLNGTEIARYDLANGATYSTFSINGSAHLVEEVKTVAIPAGLLHAGENVVAVEVHQKQIVSSDVYFDLGLSYAVAASATGGLEVPAAGLKLQTRVLTGGGEWSALETIDLLGASAPSFADPKDAVRVAAVMSATADFAVEEGDGDGSEWIALTNVTANPVLLGGVRITCAKTKNGVVDSPKCDFTFAGDETIPAHGTLVLAKADYWPSGKITNGAVEMRVYADDATVIQSLYFDTGWWSGACDCTGEHFIARAFGAEVREQAQWTTSFSAPPESPGAAALDAAAAAGDDAMREWLAALAAKKKGHAALVAFAGTEETVRQCYLLNVAPETDPGIEVSIPSIAIDGDGAPVVGGSLRLHGAETTNTVNGAIRLYHAPALEALPTTEDFVPFGNAFPVDPRAVEVPASPRRFFQLRVE